MEQGVLKNGKSGEIAGIFRSTRIVALIVPDARERFKWEQWSSGKQCGNFGIEKRGEA
jgi:hypothetical protein